MYKFRLLPISISLITLACPITLFASSELLSPATPSVTLSPVWSSQSFPVLSPEKFKNEVKNNNNIVTDGLNNELKQLLGVTQLNFSSPSSPSPIDISQTPPVVETPPANNSPPAVPTTNNTTTTSGFNPYSN